MTPVQVDFLRDFAIDNLPRAQVDRLHVSRLGGTDLYSKLAFTAVMARGRAGTTATEYAAASVLESVCLLQRPLSTKERADTLHNLTSAANDLCLHIRKTIPWLASAALEQEPPELPPAPALPLPSIAGRSLTTAEAAQALGFAPQTLRQWNSSESGPIRPIKVARRLRWSGDDILKVLEARK